MITKRVLIPQRIRKVPPSFSWLDHRLLRHGYLKDLSPSQMLLYFFLVLVGDCHGVSYYSLRTISKILKLSQEQLREARSCLCHLGLIAYERPLYQVLSLSPSFCTKPPPSQGPQSLGEIFKTLCKEKDHGH